MHFFLTFIKKIFFYLRVLGFEPQTGHDTEYRKNTLYKNREISITSIVFGILFSYCIIVTEPIRFCS